MYAYCCAATENNKSITKEIVLQEMDAIVSDKDLQLLMTFNTSKLKSFSHTFPTERPSVTHPNV